MNMGDSPVIYLLMLPCFLLCVHPCVCAAQRRTSHILLGHSLSYAIETRALTQPGPSDPLVPAHLPNTHTEHYSYKCPPASPSDSSASTPHPTPYTSTQGLTGTCTATPSFFVWVLGSKLGSYLYSKCFYLPCPGNLTRAGRE